MSIRLGRANPRFFTAPGNRSGGKGMNRAEEFYADLLKRRLHAGELLWVEYQPITLKLAHDTRYTPDFGAIAADGTFELHEVKGYMEDDARVKLMVAAQYMPFRFVLAMCTKVPGLFEVSVIGEATPRPKLAKAVKP